MTYNDKLEELHHEFAKCGTALLETQKKIEATSGFGDINEVPEYIKAHSEWQKAGQKYHEFEAYLRTQAPHLKTQQFPTP